jgi:glycosyltransferase involved in cell wall biosynthesis
MYGVIYNYVIYTILKSRKIDAIILYSAPTNGVQTILATKRLGIPVIFRSIDVLHKLVPKPLALPTKLAEKWVYRHVDKILTITTALSRYVVSLGANPDRVGILPLGIDLQCPSLPAKSKSGRLHGGTGIILRTMVFAGTLPHFSGLPALINKMPEMVARVPNLRLLIVGDGVQRPELEKMVRELGLGEQIKITGMVAHSEVPLYIQQADICVSTFPVSGATRDILPTKILQYMSCGKPVVSNPLHGMLDMGIGRKQGVVYVENDDWLTAINTAWENRDVLGSLARKYVEQEHGYSRIIDRLEKELEAQCKSH